VSTMQFLASLPAILGLAGFVVYYLLSRHRDGDKITVDIVAKLRQAIPERLPANPGMLGRTVLATLIERDAQLRSKISDQDYQLLRLTLHQQFVTSVIVYGLCALVFFAGVGLYAYVSSRPAPLSIESIAAQSTDPESGGLAVDLDPLRITWSAKGDPEDIVVYLEAMANHLRTEGRSVRSTELQVVFSAAEYHSILADREHGGSNQVRAILQTSHAPFFSSEFPIRVGTTILAAHIEPLRIKIVGMIDRSSIPYYNFEANLLLWGTARGKASMPVSYGGQILYGRNDFRLNSALHYDFSSAKLAYIGPDDSRTVRTQLLGFD
jgi:hypothetical protein